MAEMNANLRKEQVAAGSYYEKRKTTSADEINGRIVELQKELIDLGG